MQMDEKARQQIDRMCHPRGMAVFGSVGRPGSFAHNTVVNQRLYGYTGRLYPITPRGGEIDGLKVYRNLGEVDGPVDLAAVAAPAEAVPEILKECLKRGVAGAEVLASGFGETGDEEGRRLEQEIEEIARQGLRIVGPNCFGIHCPGGGITLPPGGGLSREAGNVAMISQSGGMALNFGHMAGNMGLELSKIFSFGNGCDLDAVALLKYLADDPETTCVAAYLEGVRDGRDFRSVLKALAAEKPTVIWKGGLTPLGSQAARSHTGSLAGEARIWDGILRTPGVASVQGLEEMMDTLSALRHIKSRGTRIALVGGGGAIGVFSSDLAFRWSLEIPTFSPETQKLLKDRFPTPGNSVLNPLDTGTPGLPLEVLIPLLEDIMRREPIQVMVLILLLHAVTRGRPASSKATEAPAPSPAYLENLLAALSRMKKEHGLDVVVAFENWIQDLEVEAISIAMKARYQDEGIAVFPGTARALRAIRNASLVAA